MAIILFIKMIASIGQLLFFNFITTSITINITTKNVVAEGFVLSMFYAFVILLIT